MILLTSEHREQLLANAERRDVDHIPVVKFFNPLGAGVWLGTELDEDGDIMFGLADIGYPELGYWSLSEMQSVRLAFGMGIERDLLFTGISRFPSGPRRRVRRAAFAWRNASSIRWPGPRLRAWDRVARQSGRSTGLPASVPPADVAVPDRD